MAWLNRQIQQLWWRSRLDALAEEIVDRVFEALWYRVGDRVVGMSFAESRGYTRVMAVAELNRQASMSLSWLQLPATWQPQLVAIANEQVTARIAQRAEAISRYSKSVRRVA